MFKHYIWDFEKERTTHQYLSQQDLAYCQSPNIALYSHSYFSSNYHLVNSYAKKETEIELFNESKKTRKSASFFKLLAFLIYFIVINFI